VAVIPPPTAREGLAAAPGWLAAQALRTPRDALTAGAQLGARMLFLLPVRRVAAPVLAQESPALGATLFLLLPVVAAVAV